MKKAVILTGGKQYLVSEGEIVKVELIKESGQNLEAGKKVTFEPLLVIDGDKTEVGKPTVASAKVTAEVLETAKKADKVTSIRYKAKKRVRTVRGHRQQQSIIKISKIA